MALDTFSSILGVLLQATGNNNNAWGDNANNSVFKVLERAVAGAASRAVTGGTLDLSGTAPPAGMTKAIDAIQLFTGTLASDQTVVVPNLSKIWLVNNATTGAHNLAFKTPNGVISAAIPQQGWAFVYCDGADNIEIGLSTSLRDVQWLGADGTIGAPGLSFAAEPTIGFRRVSAGVIALTIGGVDIVTFSASAVTINSTTSLSVIPPGTGAEYDGIFEPDGWYFKYGQEKSRTTDAPLFNAITALFTANTNGTATLSNLSKDLRDLGLEGSPLEGVGIQTGTTIVSVDSATQITMSKTATNTATGGSVRAMPYGVGDGSSTFNLPDDRDVVSVGRGNMGGTKRGLITTAATGIDSSLLSTVGGAETVVMTLANLIQHDHTVFLQDTGHTHSTTFDYGKSSTATGSGDASWPAISWGHGLTSSYSTGSSTTGITIWSDGGGLGSQNKVGKTGSASPTGMRVIQPSAFRNKIIKR